MQLSEANYMLMLKLLADKRVAGEVREFFINEQLSYQLSVQEVTTYTSMVSFSQVSDFASSVSHHFQPHMQIRLYHDARMSEVIHSQHMHRIKPRYDYPNKKMHLPDEKRQIMLFLKEWLQICLSQGQTTLNQTSQIFKR